MAKIGFPFSAKCRELIYGDYLSVFHALDRQKK